MIYITKLLPFKNHHGLHLPFMERASMMCRCVKPEVKVPNITSNTTKLQRHATTSPKAEATKTQPKNRVIFFLDIGPI